MCINQSEHNCISKMVHRVAQSNGSYRRPPRHSACSWYSWL